MLMKKIRLLLPFVVTVVLFVFIYLYQPVKEGQVYHRKIKLPEISEVQEESFNDDKMIQQARRTLENVFDVQIDENDYDTIVEYESSQISNHTTAYSTQKLTFANIMFKDEKTNDIKYVVECNTISGEILMLTRQYISPKGEAYKLTEELEEIAKTFVEKMTQLSEENFLYIEDEIQGSTYRANITMKNTYEQFMLYLDAFDGTVFYYWKVR